MLQEIGDRDLRRGREAGSTSIEIDKRTSCAALYALESSVRRRLHVKQSIGQALNTLRAHA